ncbi:ESV128 type glutaredoxin [Cotonvirus japonicus]|uniref:ESV128 type glutaredoxin n=1 Tax=Cotonvirus japonicus TaxID=2811091 RepID=A0ABM7NS00_9VIRU|nr:ESV128 type glutaredoxin [Cotonvirus japonicus]BCS82938.1 ESV128 type glutaredoxin [Cotonvirus japonicus]
MNNINPIISKIINADKDTYVIFYVDGCPYCQGALTILRSKNLPYKGYNINNIKGNMPRLLQVLNQFSSNIGFNNQHTTKPMIFLNGQFLGGMTELDKYLATQLVY